SRAAVTSPQGQRQRRRRRVVARAGVMAGALTGDLLHPSSYNLSKDVAPRTAATCVLFPVEGPAMNRIVAATLVLVLGLPVPAAHRGGGKPATPAEQYRALLKEYQDMPENLAKARTAEGRKQVVTRLRTLPQRFLELA